MIRKLRRRFILICTLSVLSVVLIVFFLIIILGVHSMDRNLDMLADRISDGGGRFPADMKRPRPDMSENVTDEIHGFINPETRFSTRYFTVTVDPDTGKGISADLEFIYSVSEDMALELAESVNGSNERGWRSHYRYKMHSDADKTCVIFIDGNMAISSLLQTTVITAVVLTTCAALVIALVVVISSRAMRPIAESYEKQRRFITDANHELKTPLTLILADIDIAESEIGNNEWLDDIRAEGIRMTDLVNQLVALSRMDEEGSRLHMTDVPLGELCAERASDFAVLAKAKNISFVSDVDTDIVCKGDAAMLHRLVSILLDNAVKYCDADGEIRFSLKLRRSSACIVAENTFKSVNKLDLARLFDRFYRADEARSSGGYGVGLSIAKAVAESHKGDICAYKKDDSHIGFKAVIKV